MDHLHTHNKPKTSVLQHQLRRVRKVPHDDSVISDPDEQAIIEIPEVAANVEVLMKRIEAAINAPRWQQRAQELVSC